MPNDVFELLGKLAVVGGGASFIAYHAFKYFAAKWLDSRFQKGFQQLVHDQNKEIERLRSELTKSFDRATKLHQREFEVLPKVWEKISEAYWTTSSLVSPLQLGTDLNRMQPKQLDAFIASCELADWQKDDVLASSDRTKKYSELIYWHRLSKAFKANSDAYVAIGQSGIFIQDPIKEKLQAILDLMHGALTEDQLNHEHPPFKYSERLHTDIDRVRTEGKTWFQEAEALIKARLWEQS